MPALLFFLLGMIFFTLVVRAWRSGEIPGKGWGFKVRVYDRDSEPFMYWMNFATYLVCAVWATIFGLMVAFGRS